MSNNYVDLSDVLNEEDIQVCPLCDCEIYSDEPVSIFIAHNIKCLGHASCVWEKRQELEI